jgi:hypothetical protein
LGSTSFFPKSYFDLVPLNSDEKELIVKLNKFDDDYFDLTVSTGIKFPKITGLIFPV